MVQVLPQIASTQETLEELVNQIGRYEAIVSAWDDSQQAVVMGLKGAIEALHKEALTRLIRTVKQESITALRQAAEDEVVYGLLRYHELIKPPLSQRLQQALAEVRPSLHSHNGDVELVAVRLPDTVEVRFTGTCSHCPASTLTLSDGVEQAIKRHCPEILYVVAVSTEVATPSASSPEDPAWRLVTSVAEIPEAGVLDIKLEGKRLLLSRSGAQVSCFHDACTHLGRSIAAGAVSNGLLTCPEHGFQYRLTDGACLTAPEMPLQRYPVRVENGRVFVQL
ncbi:MAG: NifU family protein [Oscillatoriaceae cyanobacterium Prado104]|jgi:nitrite reductase/ring-hydroxylating ferredoxin subunit/Fe-S cluster biogenesis protein NfuA|nr:NifU family protein [Oscillatoriaceae cyanobacterium Prado104]